MKRMTGDKRGYSLVELVVSILMFALGFIGVMKMQQMAIMGNGFSMQMSNALNIVDTQTEHLRGLSITDPELSVGNHIGGTLESQQGIQYNLSWTVSATALGAAVNARDITIRVTWMEKDIPHQISMNMFRST